MLDISDFSLDTLEILLEDFHSLLDTLGIWLETPLFGCFYMVTYESMNMLLQLGIFNAMALKTIVAVVVAIVSPIERSNRPLPLARIQVRVTLFVTYGQPLFKGYVTATH